MTKITADNKAAIIETYVANILSDMDSNSLYALAYDCVVTNKASMTIESLEKEILQYYPHLLD
jgi:hypothetical protein